MVAFRGKYLDISPTEVDKVFVEPYFFFERSEITGSLPILFSSLLGISYAARVEYYKNQLKTHRGINVSVSALNL